MPDEATAIDRILDRLADLPAATLASYLAPQAPQAIATLLLRLPSALAAETLAGLPEALGASALRLTAATGPASPALMERIAETLRTDLLAPPPAPPCRSGALTAILAAMPPDARSAAEAALAAKPPPVTMGTKGRPEAAPPPLRPSPGLAALLNSRVVIRDRMPMLEVVLDRHVRLLSSRLRALCGDPAEAGLTWLSSVRFGDWLNAQAPSPAARTRSSRPSGRRVGIITG